MRRREASPWPCGFPDCGRPEWSTGLCHSHYTQHRRGQPLRPLRQRTGHTPWAALGPAERLEAAYVMTTLTAEGCRLWPQVDPRWGGYGRLTVDGHQVQAHRFVFELAVGPIPEGFTLDHECHNRSAGAGTCTGGRTCRHRPCVEPTHLEPKTMAANTAASPLHRVFGRAY